MDTHFRATVSQVPQLCTSGVGASQVSLHLCSVRKELVGRCIKGIVVAVGGRAASVYGGPVASVRVACCRIGGLDTLARESPGGWDPPHWSCLAFLGALVGQNLVGNARWGGRVRLPNAVGRRVRRLAPEDGTGGVLYRVSHHRGWRHLRGPPGGSPT